MILILRGDVSMENVKITIAGDIITVKTSTAGVHGQAIKKLDADTYVSYNTGEVKEYKHSVSREDNIANVRRTISQLRDIINANATDREKLRWVTLTYAENVRDTKRVMDDFEAFNRRVRTKYGRVEYIATIEPQERGAWHLHVIYIFPDKAPYMKNEEVRNMWRQGFVNIHSVKNVGNLGAYLSLYLSNIPTTAEKDTKRAKKGARLYLYPRGIRIYRCSRGIKRPEIKRMTIEDYEKNKERYEGAFGKKCFEKATDTTSENGYIIHTTTTIYSRYNDNLSQLHDIKDDAFWAGYEILNSGRHIIRRYNIYNTQLSDRKTVYKIAKKPNFNKLKNNNLTKNTEDDNINMHKGAEQIKLKY